MPGEIIDVPKPAYHGTFSLDVDREIVAQFEMTSRDNEIAFDAEVIASGTPTRHSQHESVELVGEMYNQAKGGSIPWLDPLIPSQFNSPMQNNVLHVAASRNHYMIMDELFNRVATEDLDRLLFATNAAGETPLHVAAREGNMPTLGKMLAYAYIGNNVSRFQLSLTKQNLRGGNSVLHEAIMSSEGHDRSRMLSEIFHIIHVYTASDNNNTWSQCFYELVALRTVNEERHSVLSLAVHSGLTNIVIEILDKCLESATPTGISPLVAAILKRNLDMLTIIVNKRQEWIHLSDMKGRLPLHCAASIGFYEGVDYLLSKCKTCSIQRDMNGYLPLHAAAREGHVEVVKLLLEKCTIPIDEMLDKYGRNILHIAANNGKLNVVKYILQNPKLDKMKNQKTLKGWTPLHLATSSSHPKVVYALTWDNKVEIDMTTKHKKTALDLAVIKYITDLQNPSLRKSLTWIALKSAGAKQSPNKTRRSTLRKQSLSPGTEQYKDRVESLSVVSILIVTASVAACFAVPGEAEGTANNLKKAMFQFFIFCITISLFTSTSATILLIWGKLGLIKLLNLSITLARPLLGVALLTLSLAFLAGVYTVISKLTWLATTFVVITSILVAMLFVLYTLLFLPLESANMAARYLSHYPFIFLAWLAGE